MSTTKIKIPISRSRPTRHIFFCAALAALLFSLTGCFFFGGVKAKVSDVSGRSYDVTSVRLQKGSKLRVVCGGARMDIPFKAVSSLKIDPARISSVDGRPHYGVEVRMRSGAVFGGTLEEDGNCVICADNGLRGKSAKKAAYSAPFSSLSGVEVQGKGGEAQQGGGEGGDEEEE